VQGIPGQSSVSWTSWDSSLKWDEDNSVSVGHLSDLDCQAETFGYLAATLEPLDIDSHIVTCLLAHLFDLFTRVIGKLTNRFFHSNPHRDAHSGRPQ
jgi:hypothetical protein